MALTLTNISSIILKGEHLLSDKVYEEFTNAEYSSDSDKKGQRNHFTNDLYHLISSLQYRENHNIIDTDTVNLYLELERRLGSYIDPYSIDPNYSPPAGVIILPGDQYKTFLSLLDTPDSYSTVANYLVAVDPAQDGLIFINPSTIGTTYSFDNGLTPTSNNVQWGGSLLHDTNINIGLANQITFTTPVITGTASSRFSQFNTGIFQNIVSYDGDPINSNSNFCEVYQGTTTIGGIYFPTNGTGHGLSALEQSITFTRGAITILNRSGAWSSGFIDTSTWMVYAADYSANGKLDSRSIPDLGYIQNLYVNGVEYIGSGAGIGSVGLGGSLLRNTIISGIGTYSLTISSLSAGFGGTLTVFPENVFASSKVGYGGGGDYLSTLNLDGNTFTISMTKSRVGSGVRSIVFNGAGGIGTGMIVKDSISNAGLSYEVDYHVANASNPRWIPDKSYVDLAISGATPTPYIFGTGSLVGAGTGGSPFYPNAGNGLTSSDVTNGIILGGALNRNTTITTTGFNLNLASTDITIVNFLNGSTPIASVNSDAQYYGQGLVNYLSGFNSRVSVGLKGTMISRGIADGNTALTVVNNNYQNTGLLLNVQNYYRSALFVDYKGAIQHATITTAATGSAKGYWQLGAIKPSANNDLLMGMLVEPIFGNSTISTFGSLVGGTGYPNGTEFCNFTGGTGNNATGQVVVSGGVIQSVILTDTGVNYTVGDVLSFLIEDSLGFPVGSGGSITITAVTSYTGVINVAAKFRNAPIVLDTISTPTNFVDGMMWNDGTHLYIRLLGVTHTLI